MKAYVWMGRTSHQMNSNTMDKVRKIVVLPRSMQKTVLKRLITTLARSEEKLAMQLCSQPSCTRLST